MDQRTKRQEIQGAGFWDVQFVGIHGCAQGKRLQGDLAKV
jgi:hypothetical protein